MNAIINSENIFTAQFKRERNRLLERLQAQGINNASVLDALHNTPRHLFIDEALSSHAYADHPLPIGQGQTISQPYIVARMTEILLQQGEIKTVLEIGTGCGYQTAILAQLVEKVYTVERLQKLADKAQERLNALGLNNILYHYGDGYQGWPEHAPYEGIMVTAAPEELPMELLEQLALGGRMVIPVGAQGRQNLMKIIRTATRYEQHILDAVSFVPLRNGLD